MQRVIFLLPVLILSCSIFSGETPVQSGPMVGYATMKEVLLWVQTKESSAVKFQYWMHGNPAEKWSTEEKVTESKNGYVAKLVASDLEPGKTYDYELIVDQNPVALDYKLQFKTQKLWQFREEPPEFRFVVGSCNYVVEPKDDRPGTPYGSGYEIFESILKKKPEFMIWMGDNTYLREPDWNSKTGILHRYTHTRSLKQMQPLLASISHYAITDDHDFGPNDTDASFYNSHLTKSVFRDFWGNLNYIRNDSLYGSFTWNDVQFFLMDDRSYRTANKNYVLDRSYLGMEQIRWLLNALASSHATFKFVVIGGQVLNPAAVYENYATYDAERKYLISKIQELDIPGVIFLSGDRHHSELSFLDGKHPMYDITVSPLTAGTHNEVTEKNTLRIPGTLFLKRNFATIDIYGTWKERKLQLTLWNTEGTEVWTKKIDFK